jgi:hypothetical protein
MNLTSLIPNKTGYRWNESTQKTRKTDLVRKKLRTCAFCFTRFI